ncbi:hypothetical protein HPP92_007461 [Vanilla planifolia]|uniref:Uncharacterized protein n=1 Tax=Vanilla planifolia TaxID=51239 RepID=A0A835VAP1_VANPL|nr:hypothetical protein HPP92_007644 [Vanilla planifolia]KAG0490598.1 hypothetical protein HPP92_007461 [Vanilla planifolia]
MRSRPAREGSGNPEWNEYSPGASQKPDPTLEISVWDGGPGEPSSAASARPRCSPSGEKKPDGPSPAVVPSRGDDRHVTGDIMVSVWLGTQADEAFPESCNPTPYTATLHSLKVYQKSPKLWYLRTSVIEAQTYASPAHHRSQIPKSTSAHESPCNASAFLV